MAGVQAGRLSIEIVAEIARLQQDLDKAKRAVRSMSNDIARDTKAANDNIARMGAGFANTTQRVGVAAGGTRAAMQQLSFQLGDIAQGFAMGTRPMTIFAQQSGQVIQALSLMTNSTKGFLGFMAGPWGLVISAAAVVLVPLISKLLDTEEAVKKVEFASYRLGDAQGILGGVMDMTTGKINTQKDALLALAQAQALAGQIQARQEMASARKELGRLAAPGFNITGGMGGGFSINTGVKREEAGIIEAFTEGSMNAQEAIRGLDSLRRTGTITEKAFLDAAKAVTDFGIAAENLNVFEGTERMLDQRGTASDRATFLDPAKARRERRGRQGPTAEEIARRYNDQLLSFTLQSLEAMGQVARTVEERADLELRALEWQHRQTKLEIAADEHFNAAQKAELTAAAERLAEYRREALEFRKRQELEQQAQQVAGAHQDALLGALQAQQTLADTEAERKALALQIFDAETAFLRSRLEAVLISETANEHAKELARIDLEALNALERQRREGVSRANETSIERRLREWDKSAEQMGEARAGIGLEGLDQLIDGLSRIPGEVDSINDAFKAMRDVFQGVIQDMLAQLIRLQLQKAIVGLIGNAFGGVGGNPINLLAGTPYGGGAASGRDHVSPGTAYMVGEDGPERFIPRVPGRIEPNGANDNSALHFNITVNGNMGEREARRTGRQIASAASQKMAQTRRAGLAG